MKIKSTLLKLFLCLIVIGTDSSCSKDDDTITCALTGDWKVISIKDSMTSETIVKSQDNTRPDFNNGDITITFEEPDADGKGVFSGIKVTNGMPLSILKKVPATPN